MTTANFEHNIQVNPNETNVTNTYQGEFRRGLLDVNLLLYAINKDDFIRNSKHKKLVMTCLDHIANNYSYVYDGKIQTADSKSHFIKKIACLLGIKHVYASSSPQSTFTEISNL
jgi:hypothetical protein